MNEKDLPLINELMRQADFHIARFDNRREYSWKVALAFWGALIGAATLLRDREISPSIILIAAVAVFGLHLFWLVKVFEADQKDKLVAFNCRDISVEIINKSLEQFQRRIDTPPLTTDRKVYCDWSVLFQLATTILLATAIYFLLTSNMRDLPVCVC